MLKIHKKLPLLVAIPTTAGTGSETTLAAVITDGKEHHKYPINDFSLIPRYAVLDYRVTMGLPPALTATTGMDALTHAIAHSLGGQYGIAHGHANAVILPIMLREYGSSCERKLSELARRTEVVKEGYDDSTTAAMFIDWVQEMNDYMNIPRHIPEIQESDIGVMAKHADAEANPLYPVPKLMGKKELAAMYEIIGG